MAKRVALLGLASPVRLERRLRLIAERRALPVLNLHKVTNHPSDRDDAMSPAVFDDLVGWLAKRFSIVTFGALEAGGAFPKPPLVLSFDDGYLDFVDTVAPILRKHGVRANQNVVPGCVDSGLPPLNVVLKDFIAQAPRALLRELSLPGLPAGLDPDRRLPMLLKASSRLKNLPIARQKEAWPAIRAVIERFDGFRPTPLMTRQNIVELLDEHELGLHSFEHATMALESDAYVADDAERCRDWWRRVTGRAAHIYAFPNGAAGPNHADIVEKRGFRTVLMVDEKFSRRSALRHHRLTMFGFSRREAQFRALGAFSPIPAVAAPSPSASASPGRKPKIAFLLPLLGPVGGTERVTNALMRDFLDRGASVDLLAVERIGELPSDLPSDVDIVEIDAPKVRHALVPLIRYLRRERPDALIASVWPLTICAPLARIASGAPTRIVVCDHNTLSSQYQGRGALHRAALRLSIGIFYRLADVRVAVSDGVAQDVARLGLMARDRIDVAENPVPWLPDLADDPRDRQPPPAWRRATKRILTVGNLKSQKNHDLLVRAFALLAREQDAVLMIVGGGAEEAPILATAAELGVADRVILYGIARNPAPLYRSADLFVLSSDYEGFGLVIVEALQFGLPVVSTDCPSGPRRILENGLYGALTPPGDVSALARAMSHALRETVDRDRQVARAREFLPENAAALYWRLARPGSRQPGPPHA